MPDAWMSDLIRWLAHTAGTDLFVVKGLVALVVVCTLCGAVGALVVGNRMAFFSDAMAHCAFAGVALGVLGAVFVGGGDPTRAWLVPLAMIAFGVLVGAAMVFVRDRTGLAHDTVIGVFFAFALGFGAALTKVVQRVEAVNLETFLFGNLILIPETDLFFLCCVLAVVFVAFVGRYNQLMFASFNPSLARTRRMSVTLNNYLFIVLLALVVNLSIKAVGALLINALLVVPAAAAANVSRSLRQMFWLTLLFCLGSGLFGYWLSEQVSLTVRGEAVRFSASGVIVCTCVAAFFASMAAAAVWNRFAPIFGGKRFRRPPGGGGDPCGEDHPFGQCP